MNHAALEDTNLSELEREAFETRTDISKAINKRRRELLSIYENAGNAHMRNTYARHSLP